LSSPEVFSSVRSYLSLVRVPNHTPTHTKPIVCSLSPVGRGEVTGHSSRIVVVGRRPVWSPSRDNEGGGHGRLHGRHERLLDGRQPSSSCSTAFIPRILAHCSQKPSKSDAGFTGGPTTVEFNAEPTDAQSMWHARVPSTGDHPRRGPRQRC
jgi:hypothetical protein